MQDAPGHVQRLAAAAAAQPAPVLTALTLCDAGVTSPCDDGTPERACVAANPTFDEIHGQLSVPIFQQGTPPYDTPDERAAASSRPPASPQLARTEDVCFALTIPKGVAAPAAGWPLVVYHHGTGGSMRSIVNDGIAAALAGATPSAAVLGFDAVEHGARRGRRRRRARTIWSSTRSTRAPRATTSCRAPSTSCRRCASPASPSTPRASPTGAAIAFDPAAVTFFGHSQGSTSGALALPFTDARAGGGAVGRGRVPDALAARQTQPVDLAAGLAFAAGEPLDAAHPVMTLFQSFFDRSDPLNTTR